MVLIAFDSKNTLGQRDPPDESLMIHEFPPYESDLLKILQSKSIRRSKFKSQVFNFPRNTNVRTRLDHTLEVVALSRMIAYRLGLNVPLVTSIAYLHDLGHFPGGHITELVLSDIVGKPVKHYNVGPMLVQDVERKGLGMNPHFETLEGAALHSSKRQIGTKGASGPILGFPAEYAVVWYADKIAYTFSDVNDIIRYGLLEEKDFPSELNYLYGFQMLKTGRQRSRNDACLRALIQESTEKGFVSFEDSVVAKNFKKIRDFMYNVAYKKVDRTIHKDIIKYTFDYFQKSLPYKDSTMEIPFVDPVVCISLLTDLEMRVIGDSMMDTRTLKIPQIQDFGLFEILPYIGHKHLDYSNPGLDWGKKEKK